MLLTPARKVLRDPAELSDSTQVRKVGLSPRLKDILALMALGHSFKIIGEWLFITEQTVKNHAHRLKGIVHYGKPREALDCAIAGGFVTMEEIVALQEEIPRRNGIREESGARDLVSPSDKASLLTPRLKVVAALIGSGLDNKSIGRWIGVSELTMRGMIRKCQRILGCSTRAEIPVQVIEQGIMTEEDVQSMQKLAAKG